MAPVCAKRGRAVARPRLGGPQRQESVQVAEHGAADGVVRVRFGSLSQITWLPFFLMYLYWMAVPPGSVADPRQTG